MKVIVAGGRNFQDYALLEATLLHLFSNTSPDEIEIVSGGAKGADALGEQFAKIRQMLIQRFPADWRTHGKKAGFIRNMQMAEAAECLVAFWNGSSPGTRSMIQIARSKGLRVRVIRY